MTTTMTQHAESASGSPLPAHRLGNAFTRKYYSIFQHSPEMAHMFYHEDSCLARPSASGDGRDCVTTLRAIKAKFMEMAKPMVRTEILTVDSHDSHIGGVTVLVTGTITFAHDMLPRAFVQSFFLAPQMPSGYYVRNDTFRYVGGGTSAATAPADSPAAAADEKKGGKSRPEPFVAVPTTTKVTAAAEEERTDGVHGHKKTVKRSRDGEEAEDAAGSNRLGRVLGKLRRLLFPPVVVSVSDEEEEIFQAEESQAVTVDNKPEENDLVLVDR